MSKKTKKEKIIAAYRRKMKLLEQKVINEPQEALLTPLTLPVKKITQNRQQPEEENKIRQYFLKDLKKSFMVIFLIITLEIIIYYASINKYLIQ